jgi:SagB-type dehydrogenase family enzyme
MKTFLLIVLTLVFIPVINAQKVVSLPPPQTEGGVPLMTALKNRQTNREFGDKKLTIQQLSNLLWAADGINRPETKKRTAPSAMNYQEVDIYIAIQDGLFMYNAEKHQLEQLSGEDIRKNTGIQEFVATAPVNLIFVADYAKMAKAEESTKESYSMADAAYISANVYLFCSSEGLNTGVRAWIDKENLAKLMKLKPTQHIILAQSVGYPK